jgi:hypothetical protein
MPLASADRDAQPVRQWVRTGENLGPFSHAVVGPSPFLAISKRAGGFSLVNPQDLTRKMVARDLELVHQSTRPLPSGKSFWLGIFKRPVTTTLPGGADSGAKLIDSPERRQDVASTRENLAHHVRAV